MLRAAELLEENEEKLVGPAYKWFATDDCDINWVAGDTLVAVPPETWAVGPSGRTRQPRQRPSPPLAGPRRRRRS